MDGRTDSSAPLSESIDGSIIFSFESLDEVAANRSIAVTRRHNMKTTECVLLKRPPKVLITFERYHQIFFHLNTDKYCQQ